ncbi:DUF1007 family protein [Halomonas daqiaonensis]|uniref:ABC-type uncharacterized transport system, substrate-binding protein n=1 Tax=Halomonas daqiaonensis TaxID=650850 RepID=A0A1H7RAT9_9GAMM|nr:DUF1007 family protein [Halomonas daqiaonensis]SEL57386.1 ABC-type uncharacterized transport system, substrate-binding protein [Halomonas daqiaonensis]
MTRTVRRGLAMAAIMALGLTAAGMVQAHPHGWIDLRMRLVFDGDGRLEALQQSWRLDPFYSLVVLEELEQEQGDGGLEAALDQLGSEMRDTLSPQGYFTELQLGEGRLGLGEVDDYTVLARDGRIEFVFLLPLTEPRAIEGETLSYRVFDPTYYIEVVHEAEDEAPLDDALVVGSELDCETRILAAEPDAERIMEAAMLDVDDTAAAGLGRHFAETGEVVCR